MESAATKGVEVRAGRAVAPAGTSIEPRDLAVWGIGEPWACPVQHTADTAGTGELVASPLRTFVTLLRDKASCFDHGCFCVPGTTR